MNPPDPRKGPALSRQLKRFRWALGVGGTVGLAFWLTSTTRPLPVQGVIVATGLSLLMCSSWLGNSLLCRVLWMFWPGGGQKLFQALESELSDRTRRQNLRWAARQPHVRAHPSTRARLRATRDPEIILQLLEDGWAEETDQLVQSLCRVAPDQGAGWLSAGSSHTRALPRSTLYELLEHPHPDIRHQAFRRLARKLASS